MDTIKKKKKSNAERLFASYKTYEGEPGSPDQWAAQARLLRPALGSSSSLAVLGLSSMPSTIDELKKIRRKVMLENHPDRGGTDKVAAAINNAYDQISKLIATLKPVAVRPPQKASGLIVPPRCTGDKTKETKNHVAELKLDGERFLLYIGFDPYSRNALPNTILSRHKSTADQAFTDRSGNVPHITENLYPSLKGTVLDGEIFLKNFETTASIMSSTEAEALDKQTSQKLVYYVFDIPVYKGEDIRSKPLSERKKILSEVIKEMNNPHVKPITEYRSDFEKAFKEITTKGGEGLIIKDLRSGYGQEWAKLKKSFDISCIVTGYRMGKDKDYIGSFEVSVYKGKDLIDIGFVSGYACLEKDVDKYMGKVVDVFAHEFTKQQKLRMPTFHRFRNDLNPEDCTLEKLKEDFTKIKSSREKLV
jgi:ATP-dependent DNA ligase